ncbi:MAG: hypothetical protein ACLFR1_14100 [Spirochaetia bacterium]
MSLSHTSWCRENSISSADTTVAQGPILWIQVTKLGIGVSTLTSPLVTMVAIKKRFIALAARMSIPVNGLHLQRPDAHP